MAPVKKKLTESEWSLVFRIRCRSKSGHQPSHDEMKLLERAFKEDPERYKAMDERVFDETKPFGAK